MLTCTTKINSLKHAFSCCRAGVRCVCCQVESCQFINTDKDKEVYQIKKCRKVSPVAVGVMSERGVKKYCLIFSWKKDQRIQHSKHFSPFKEFHSSNGTFSSIIQLRLFMKSFPVSSWRASWKLKGVNNSSIEKTKTAWCTCTKVPWLGQQG